MINLVAFRQFAATPETTVVLCLQLPLDIDGKASSRRAVDACPLVGRLGLDHRPTVRRLPKRAPILSYVLGIVFAVLLAPFQRLSNVFVAMLCISGAFSSTVRFGISCALGIVAFATARLALGIDAVLVSLVGREVSQRLGFAARTTTFDQNRGIIRGSHEGYSLWLKPSAVSAARGRFVSPQLYHKRSAAGAQKALLRGIQLELEK